VIHRDIKPENILLHGGHALVADFGIALAASRSEGATRMTETGMSLGTPAYMSPEQAMGERDITPKADIYALGATLYEMLSGEPPFVGPTAQAIVARVMTEEPRSLVLQRKSIPPHVEAAVRQALEKLPADRFASAADFAAALGDPSFARARAGVPVRGRAWWHVPAIAVAGLLAGAAIGVGGTAWSRRAPTPPPITRFALVFGHAGQPGDGAGSPIAVAPDGSSIAYKGSDSTGGGLYLRPLDRVNPVRLAGTDDAEEPFFSPDGRWLGFVSGNQLRKLSLVDGSAVTVAEQGWTTSVAGAAWIPGDTIVLSLDDRLWKLSARGGPLNRMALVDSTRRVAYRWPQPLSDDGHVLVTAIDSGGSPRLVVVSVRDGRVTDLGLSGVDGRWVDPGYIVFARTDSMLAAAPFDARRLRVTGPAVPLGVRVGVGPAFPAKVGVARTGTVAFPEFAGGSIALSRLVVVARDGAVRDLPGMVEAAWAWPRFSPDGRKVAVTLKYETWQGDIWVYDVASRTSLRLTFDSLSAIPSWSLDGRAITFTRLRVLDIGKGVDFFGLARVASDGSGALDTLLSSPGAFMGEAQFTPDGQWVVYRRSPADIWLARSDSLSAGRPLRRTPFIERSLALSRDGRWLAYVSNETGSAEVYVEAMHGPAGHTRVSTSGGSEPVWARSGRELFYRNGDTVLAVPVEPGPAFRAGRPRPLFTGHFQSSLMTTRYDVTPDGRGFLMVRRASAEPRDAQIDVILNLFQQPALRRPPGEGQ
jgi:Tol biopolymer transport system component